MLGLPRRLGEGPLEDGLVHEMIQLAGATLQLTICMYISNIHLTQTSRPRWILLVAVAARAPSGCRPRSNGDTVNSEEASEGVPGVLGWWHHCQSWRLFPFKALWLVRSERAFQ